MLRITGIIIALALAAGIATAASAAPGENNPNAHVLAVECDGLGTLDVVTVDNAPTAFGPDGRVYVAKRLAFESVTTITTFDGEVFGPYFDSFEEGARGSGFQGRLFECTFTQAETFTFTLDAEGAEFLGIPDEYIGTEVIVEGAADGTAWVLAPGR
jgi:hypothetical protein